MRGLKVGGVTLNVREEGPGGGPALVFVNSLGTDHRIWDPLLPHLPAGLRLIRYDKRGHGLSDCPDEAWGMGDHVADLAGILDALGVRSAVVCGLSVGGMIAQGLAAERPDLVRAMILCDTGAKIGSPEMWDARIAAIREGGIAALADAILERWFTRAFWAGDPSFPVWRNMLLRSDVEGYMRTCAARRRRAGSSVRASRAICRARPTRRPWLPISGSRRRRHLAADGPSSGSAAPWCHSSTARPRSRPS